MCAMASGRRTSGREQACSPRRSPTCRPACTLASSVPLGVAVPRLHDGQFHAAVTHVDRCGNLSINVDAVAAAEAGIVVGGLLDVGVEGYRLVVPFGEAFGSVPPAEPVVTEDSHVQP